MLMRNKILIVDANHEDREQLETILQEVVNSGGELFFADNREDGLAILKKEIPQLVFLDASLAGDVNGWIHEKVQVIFMCNKHEQNRKNEDFVVKPLKRHPVLEKCRAFLSAEPVSPIPPM
jgi:DNA-binding response OmpR family regulator